MGTPSGFNRSPLAASAKERHVSIGYNLGNNTFVAVTTSHLVARVPGLRLQPRRNTLTCFITPGGPDRHQRRTFSTLSSKRASKVRFWISYCSFRASTILRRLVFRVASCTTDRATSDASRSSVIFRVSDLTPLGPLTAILPMIIDCRPRVDVAVKNTKLIVAGHGPDVRLLSRYDLQRRSSFFDAVTVKRRALRRLYQKSPGFNTQRCIAHVRCFLTKDWRAAVFFPSGVIAAFRPWGVILPTRMSPGSTPHQCKRCRLIEVRSAFFTTFGISRVISSAPPLYHGRRLRILDLWIEVNTSSRDTRSEIRMESFVV